MYKPKQLNFGCVILCPDQNARSLFITARSIQHYINSPLLAVVPKGTKRVVTDAIKNTCNFVRGSVTHASLINTGIQRSTEDWNLVIFAGSIVKPRFWKKYTVFLKDEMDIMYPLVDDKTNFIDGSMNGILMHKNVLKRVGKIPEISEIEPAKTTWSSKCLEKGYQFKGILGVGIN